MIHPSQSNSVPIFHRESARARMRERRKEKGKKQTTLNSSIKLISTSLIYILIKWCASCRFLETPTPVTRLLEIRSISLVFLFFFFFSNQVNPSTLASLLNAPTHAYDSSNHKQSINSSRSQRLRQLTHRSSTSGDGHLCRKPSKTSTATSWRGRPYPKQLSIMTKTANAEKILFSWTIVIVNFILLTSNFYIT